MLKKGVLLVSFGTSHKDARENSLESIYRDLIQVCGDIPVRQAYTSGMIIRKLAEEGIKIDTVEEAADRLLEERVECLYVLPTHMIPGYEYQKLLAALDTYRPSFQKLLIAEPVLAKEEDCERLIPVLQEILGFRRDYEYILMGHGTLDEANVRYGQMNEALRRAGLFNVRIASVEAKPDLADAVKALRQKESVKKVIVHPFMVVAGDHAKNDMAGEQQSYVTGLEEAGFPVEAVVKGLGEYARFRKLYVDKFREMCGILYGIGVGPGDPELMTIKAARLLQECDVIGIPAKDAATCTAYRIALGAVPEIVDRPVAAVPIPMTTGKSAREAAYDRGCALLAGHLDAGRKVAFLNLGDPMVYGTWLGIHERMQRAGYAVEVVSGVPSFCAVAAALGVPLGSGDERIHILPGFYRPEEVGAYEGTRVLMKSAGRLTEVKERLVSLEKQGSVRAWAVTNCGMESQSVCHSIRELDENAGYFTTIIVKDGREQ